MRRVGDDEVPRANTDRRHIHLTSASKGEEGVSYRYAAGGQRFWRRGDVPKLGRNEAREHASKASCIYDKG